ncbi:MAG: nucleotidyltransferase domain-containing protein [Minisyncoccales bacterium]
MDKIKELKKKISPVLKRNDVKKLSVFGSVARGEDKMGSDIDLLVKFNGQKGLADLVGLKIELEDKLNRKVDIIHIIQ